MRLMVIVKVTEDAGNEAALPDPQLMADLNKFNDDLLEAGVLIGYDGLHPSCQRRPRPPLRQDPPDRH